MSIALFLSVAAIAYNNVINRWGPFHRGAYVPVNLVFAAGLTLVAAWALELSPGELGLRADLGSVALPFAAVALFAKGR
jgi:hypothetical protein